MQAEVRLPSDEPAPLPDNVRELHSRNRLRVEKIQGLLLAQDFKGAADALAAFQREHEQSDFAQATERAAVVADAKRLLDGGQLPEAHSKLGELLSKPSGKIDLISGLDIFAQLPPTNWLVEALELAPGAPAIWAGLGFSGKTYAAQSLALSVATGRDVWGSFACRTGKVLHLDFEQGKTLTLRRYQKLARGAGIGPHDVADRLTVAPLPRVSLCDPATERRLLDMCADVALCIVDSFRAACPEVDENSSEARKPLDMLNRVSEVTATVFLVIHHSRKPPREGGNEFGGARMTMRGSVALYDAVACQFVFGGKKNEPTVVKHEKARISGKLRDDFTLEIRDLFDPDGRFDGVEVVASSIVNDAEREQPERVKRASESARIQQAILDALAEHPEGLSGHGIREKVGGNRDRVLGSLDLLVANQRVVVTSGPRNAKVHRLTHRSQSTNGANT